MEFLAGVAGFDGASPIYGIEIGLINEVIKVIDENGEEKEIHVASPIKTRITPDEWSLWRNDQKICYTSENAIYFPTAHITGGSINIGDYFNVDNAGNLKASNADISGKITATSGEVGGWSISPTTIYKDKTFNGITYRPFMQVGDSNASINTRVFGVRNLTENTWPFYVTYGGKLVANNAVIRGEIEAGSILGSGVYFANGRYQLFSDETGFRISAPIEDKAPYFVMNNSAIHLIAKNTMLNLQSNYGALIGTWYETNGNPVTSDINKKNTINKFGEKYNVFFDLLEGCTFKFNDGTSDRLHSGFIAQKVKEALDIANLDTSEFGGLVIRDNDDGTKDWYLRYEEFISLNTWQIQKLKDENKKTKEEMLELKAEIAELKTLLNSLRE